MNIFVHVDISVRFGALWFALNKSITVMVNEKKSFAVNGRHTGNGNGWVGL